MTNHKSIVAGLGIVALLSFSGCTTKSNDSDASPQKMAALKLFSDGRDYYTIATLQGNNDAVANGYKLVRVEGYVFTSQQAGTAPLKQYWSEQRHDHWLLSRDIPKNVEKNGAYQFVRIEGYVYTNAQPGTVALKHFSLVRGDNFTFASRQSEIEARAAGYEQRHLVHAFVIPEREYPVPTAVGSEKAPTAVQSTEPKDDDTPSGNQPMDTNDSL